MEIHSVAPETVAVVVKYIVGATMKPIQISGR